MKTDMRVLLTKRLLREGLIRLLKEKSMEKITVQELCAESGINRTTFYKHYQAPIQVLHDMAWDYAAQLQAIFEEHVQKKPANESAALEACCEYLSGKKEEIRILFSENAGHHLEMAAVEIMADLMKKKTGAFLRAGLDEDAGKLYVSASGMAVYGLLRCWLTEDIDKTPREIVAVVQDLFRERWAESLFL